MRFRNEFPNPRCAYGLDGFAGDANHTEPTAVLTRETTDGYRPGPNGETTCAQFVADPGTSTIIIRAGWPVATFGLPAEPYTMVLARVAMKLAVGSAGAVHRLRIKFYDDSGAIIYQPYVAEEKATVGEWVEVVGFGMTPPNTVKYALELYTFGTNVRSTLRVTDVMTTFDPEAIPSYVVGDQAGSEFVGLTPERYVTFDFDATSSVEWNANNIFIDSTNRSVASAATGKVTVSQLNTVQIFRVLDRVQDGRVAVKYNTPGSIGSGTSLGAALRYASADVIGALTANGGLTIFKSVGGTVTVLGPTQAHAALPINSDAWVSVTRAADTLTAAVWATDPTAPGATPIATLSYTLTGADKTKYAGPMACAMYYKFDNSAWTVDDLRATPTGPVPHALPSLGPDEKPATDKPGLWFGFNGNSSMSNNPLRTLLDMTESVGANTARYGIDLRGSEFAAVNPDLIDWSKWDRLYEAYRDAGVHPIPTPVNCPAAIRINNQEPHPDHYEDWAAIAAAMAERWPESAAIEICNETNTTGNWTTRSASEYVALLAVSYDLIKAAVPGMTVLNAGIGDAISGSWTRCFTYLQQMYTAVAALGLPEIPWEGISIHPYMQYPSSQVENLGCMAFIDSIRAVRDANGDSGRPLWISETGMTTTKPPASSGVVFTDHVQASTIAHLYPLLLAQDDIAAIIIHTLITARTSLTDTEKGYELFTYPTWQPREAFYALQRVRGSSHYGLGRRHFSRRPLPVAS